MKRFFKLKTNLSPISKICLSGMFIALAIIFQKVIAINNISFLPFLRISFGGPAIIIFSSILLGPFYGLLVGVASDLLGMLVLDPNPWLFQITLLYASLGFFSYYIFQFFCKIKNTKISFIIFESIFVLLYVGIILFFALNDSIVIFDQTYTFQQWQKILIYIISFILIALINLFILFFKKRYKNKVCNLLQLSISLFVIEIAIMLILGVILKSWAFGWQTFLPIFICQVFVSFVNILLNIVLISIFLKITSRYFIYEKEN